MGGVKPGRRFLTQQLNYAYAMLLAARFQGFVRTLHSQTVDAVAEGAHDATYRTLLRRKKLWALIIWRNAITHDDIDAKLAKGALEPGAVSLGTCRVWRSALNILAASLDDVAAGHCQTLGLRRPW